MKKVLIVVDMQNDFITGALKNEAAEKIISTVIDKIKEYQDNGDIVFFTQDTHYENSYLKSEEGKHLPVPHCIEGTYGWEITAPLQKYIGSKPFIKHTFGCVDLMEAIGAVNKLTPVESIELIGLCTDICVISNAMLAKAYCPNTPILIDAACCAGVTPESHNNALEAMKMCHIEVANQGEEPWQK